MRKAAVIVLILLLSLVPYAGAQQKQKFEISSVGFRLIEWTVDGKNIISAGERGALGRSYPLWDWLLSEPWPGSLATVKYELRKEGSRVVGSAEAGQISVEKTFEVLDKNRAELSVKLTNTGDETFRSEVSWDGFSLGYALAWAGYLGNPGGEQQIWIDAGGSIHIESKNWVRIGAKLKAFGLVDFGEGLIALVFPKEETTALWLESSGWGMETRAEFPPLVLKPGESRTYRFSIFTGKIDDLRNAFPEIYNDLKPYISKENYKIAFETPDFPVEGEKIEVTVRLTPREPSGGYGILKAGLSCGESREVKVPLDRPSSLTLTGTARESCRISAELEVNGTPISSAERSIPVFKKGGKPLYVVFIWHNHQSPGVWPNGTLHGPWGLIHAYKNELEPYYTGGAYYFHAWILQKYPQIKMTYHLSPSLLWQWNLSYSRWCQSYPRYQCFNSTSPEAKMVRETMGLYRKLYGREQIEILTSYFAHPISGYIAEKYGWFDLLNYELSLGKRTTEEVMGVNATGMWLPEMAFSMKLVPLLENHSITHFALDDRCHLNTIYSYSPYHLYRIQNSSLLVLFRDHTISDDFAFNNNFRSEEEAREKAKRIVEEILAVRNRDPDAEVVTIAADGENWIIFSNNPGLTARYFEFLLQYLSEAQQKGLIKTATFEEVTKILKPYREVKPLSTSWLCSWDKWTTEKRSKQQPMWKKDEEVYSLIQEYRKKCGDDAAYRKALYGLSQALDSDFYWAEFIYDRHVYAWLNWTEGLIKANIGKCSTTGITGEVSSSTSAEKKGICGTGTLALFALIPLLLRRRS
ncbi:hypothetical protein [Thermococcus sp.]